MIAAIVTALIAGAIGIVFVIFRTVIGAKLSSLLGNAPSPAQDVRAREDAMRDADVSSMTETQEERYRRLDGGGA